MVKFEVDLNNVPLNELEHIIEMKKKGVYKVINGKEAPEKDKREALISELDGKEEKPTVKREYYSRELLNWDNIVKDAKRVLKDTMKPYKITILLKEARGLASSSDNISGKQIAIFRKYLKNNMWGIKKVGTDYMHRLVAGKGKRRYAKTDVHSKRMRWVCSRANALMGIDNLSRTDAMRKACAEWRNNLILNPPKDIKKPDNRVKRARFIGSRAGHLMANDVHLSRIDALRRASDEWNTQGFKKNVINAEDNAEEKKSKPFLKFESINSQYDVILQGIIKNVIKNKGEIKYNDVNYSLDIKDIYLWHDFIAEFMSKSHLISAYFNVENKFKHNRVGRYDTISYGSNGVFKLK